MVTPFFSLMNKQGHSLHSHKTCGRMFSRAATAYTIALLGDSWVSFIWCVGLRYRHPEVEVWPGATMHASMSALMEFL